MNFTTSANTAPLCPAPFGDKITILNAHQQKSPLDAPKGARLHSMPGFVDFYRLSFQENTKRPLFRNEKPKCILLDFETDRMVRHR